MIDMRTKIEQQRSARLRHLGKEAFEVIFRHAEARLVQSEQELMRYMAFRRLFDDLGIIDLECIVK